MPVYCDARILKLLAKLLIQTHRLPDSVHLVLDEPRGYALYALVPSHPGHPLLVVTGSTSPFYLRDLLELGVDGLLTEPRRPEEIVHAYRRVAEGEQFYDGPQLSDSPLSPRERQILRAVAIGRENYQIAHTLRISSRTVSNFISMIKEKLSVRNHVELSLVYFGLPPYVKNRARQ